jgi:ATP-binding cassette subfamily B protein RaxB
MCIRDRYRKPHILFLDEAFDQLDLALEQQITVQLRKIGLGLVVVSHRPETVREVDRLVRLGDTPGVG